MTYKEFTEQWSKAQPHERINIAGSADGQKLIFMMQDVVLSAQEMKQDSPDITPILVKQSLKKLEEFK